MVAGGRIAGRMPESPAAQTTADRTFDHRAGGFLRQRAAPQRGSSGALTSLSRCPRRVRESHRLGRRDRPGPMPRSRRRTCAHHGRAAQHCRRRPDSLPAPFVQNTGTIRASKVPVNEYSGNSGVYPPTPPTPSGLLIIDRTGHLDDQALRVAQVTHNLTPRLRSWRRNDFCTRIDGTLPVRRDIIRHECEGDPR